MRAFILVGLVTLLFGCGFERPADIQCEIRDVAVADPACPPEAPICTDGQCGGRCASDADCSARDDGDHVCLTSMGACAACDEAGVQVQPGSSEDECPDPARAVCDADTHGCRACRAHGECVSGVCDDGVCVDEVNVVYMSSNGGDIGDCRTADVGCLTLDYALSKVTAARRYILMAPASAPYSAKSDGTGVEIIDKDVDIVGPGAGVHRVDENGVIINVQGNSHVVIDGLTVSGTLGGSGVANSGTLELVHVTVRGNSQHGVLSIAGELRVISSTISANQAGGVLVSGGGFVIVNNFIFDNGGNASVYGGVYISTGTSGNRLEFNTIFGRSQTGAPDGITCANFGLVARNNIILGVATKPRVDAGSNCTFQSNLYGPDGTITGTGNTLVTDLATFKFAGGADYHVQLGTVATGKANATNLTADTLKDIDGDPRQQGGSTVEVGADEIP